MFAQTFGSTTLGLNGVLTVVEVDIGNGIPCFDIVGLPDMAVKESRERVKAAIKNAGFEFPAKRITVNLAPADLKKDSSGLDLPIAVALLAASGQIEQEECKRRLFVSELSLEGKLRGVSGMLPMAINAREEGIKEVFVARDNVQESLLVDDITVYGPYTLTELVLHLRGDKYLEPQEKLALIEEIPQQQDDFADVQGQLVAKRALEIAAAGGHNVLMIGPPGSGKSMLAKRIPSILPAMSTQEALEVTKIYSVAGMLKNNMGLISNRQFRSPHHTISDAGLIGGGRIPRPGEVTLSHNGVLFLDELPEFPRVVLEVLRQPLEDGKVTISRVTASLSYPAKFVLISAMNPCPCGFSGDAIKPCTCSPNDIRRYLKKISGPLLDRIDIHVHVPRLEYSEMTSIQPAESSKDIRTRVERARELQRSRLKKYNIYCNSQMAHRHLKTTCSMTNEAEAILKQAFSTMSLSGRGYDRIIKVARTIADLEQNEKISGPHIAEAIQFRNHVQGIG